MKSTVGVIYTTVFEYQNQVIFNMTVFDVGTLVVIFTLELFLEYQKQVIFQYDVFLKGGFQCQTKMEL
jgi:hypothetical protein